MLNIRNLLPADIKSAIALQSRVYPTIAPFRADQFAHLLEIFPRGQFAAVLEERLVGIAVSLVIVWEHYKEARRGPDGPLSFFPRSISALRPPLSCTAVEIAQV